MNFDTPFGLPNNADLEDLQANFVKNSQKVEEKAKTLELTEELKQVRSRNQERLHELKERLPEQAQNGIDTAIENSQKSQERNALAIFEGDSFHVKVKTDLTTAILDSNNEEVEIDMYQHYYFVIKDGQPVQTSIDEADYNLTIEDAEEFTRLMNAYKSGEEVSLDEITDIVDIPLKLKAKALSSGLRGLN